MQKFSEEPGFMKMTPSFGTNKNAQLYSEAAHYFGKKPDYFALT